MREKEGGQAFSEWEELKEEEGCKTGVDLAFLTVSRVGIISLSVHASTVVVTVCKGVCWAIFKNVVCYRTAHWLVVMIA